MDIDIDLSTKFDPKIIFPEAVRASMVEKGILKPHPVGYLFQNIATDALTQLSAIPYTECEENGYLKIDMLHLTVLDIFQTKAEIKHLLKKEPDWNLLNDESVVKRLFHLGNHYDVVRKIKPKSVEELADVLALIRPGKTSLIDKYIRDKVAARKVLYMKNKNSDLRKSHAIPYALIIVLQLHLIKADIL